jgi:hypothetical protein
MMKSWVARFFGLRHLGFFRHSKFVLRHPIRIRTAKVFSRKISGEDFAKRKADEFTE